jgi:plastocyanin
MKSRPAPHYFVVLLLFLLLISIMFPIDLMKSITNTFMALAQKVDNLELEKVLVEDVIQDLQKNDTKSASIHLDLAERQLSLLPSNSTSIATARLLIQDANKALKNNDFGTTILHMKLADQQISVVPTNTQLLNNTGNPTTVGVASAVPSIINLTVLQGASIQGNPACSPDPVTVKRGDVIQVVNKDSVPHTVTNGKGPDDSNSGKLFDTSIVNAGESAKIDTSKLTSGQQYPFHCTVHPYMGGTLKVVELGTPPLSRNVTTSTHANMTLPGNISNTQTGAITTNVSSILGLNSSNIDKAMEAQSRLINIAKLHNASTSELYSEYSLLSCVSNVVNPGSAHFNSPASCDDDVTDMIVKHELGNNQTMIKVAYAYLKNRGIQ